MTISSLLRSAYRHAIESARLAAAAELEIANSYRLAAGIEDKVMEAARPHLELAQLNAELTESYARDAEKYRGRVLKIALERSGGVLPSYSQC